MVRRLEMIISSRYLICQIKRTVQLLELKQGQNEVQIKNLPSCLDQDSIRVDGIGSAVIFDVIYRVFSIVLPSATSLICILLVAFSRCSGTCTREVTRDYHRKPVRREEALERRILCFRSPIQHLENLLQDIIESEHKHAGPGELHGSLCISTVADPHFTCCVAEGAGCGRQEAHGCFQRGYDRATECHHERRSRNGHRPGRGRRRGDSVTHLCCV